MAEEAARPRITLHLPDCGCTAAECKEANRLASIILCKHFMYGCRESESQMCYLPTSVLHLARAADGAGAVFIVWDLGGLLFKLMAESHHDIL